MAAWIRNTSFTQLQYSIDIPPSGTLYQKSFVILCMKLSSYYHKAGAG